MKRIACALGVLLLMPSTVNSEQTSPGAGPIIVLDTAKGVIEIDGKEHSIEGVGNGALSSLANAIKNLGIELDIADYEEHAITTKATGEKGGKNVKAATYIECTAFGSKQKVWGVGIHEDVVLASLHALLSAASSVCSS